MPALDRISTKLARLAGLDPNYRLYGARRHRYELRPTLKEAQLQEFEALHRVTLPEGYRRFLLEVGDGGAGPHDGLHPLETSFHNPYVELGPLAEAFPLTEAWCPSRGQPPGHRRRGCLVIEHIGCGYLVLLVVSGPERGRVWQDMTAGDGGIEPIGKEFTEWYEGWLDRRIEELSEQSKTRAARIAAKREALAARSDDPQLHLDLAEAHLSVDERSEEARQLLQRAIELGAPGLAAWERLCAIFRAAEDWPRLEETARDAKTRLESLEEAGDPVDDVLRARIHYYLGVALSNLGRHEEAVAELQDARDLRLITRSGYRFTDIRTYQAWSLRHLGQFELARTHLRSAPRSTPRASAHVYRELGLVNANLFKHREAIEAYRRALACYRELGSKESAADILCTLGDAHSKAGEPVEAERCYREALLSDPESRRARQQLEETGEG